MRDDPHGAFNNMSQLQANVTALGTIFNAFMADCAATPDPSGCGQPLSQGVVFTIHGDTPKDPTVANGWPDGTPSNSNWMYVYGNGFLKTGWFGNVSADRVATGFDPTTGALVPGQGSRSHFGSVSSSGSVRRGQGRHDPGAGLLQRACAHGDGQPPTAVAQSFRSSAFTALRTAGTRLSADTRAWRSSSVMPPYAGHGIP